ncbi:ATP-binding protein [Rhodohalobacter halophilus]|uniref:ATP-binding protein n=1 Tax=Rhodohalobacter halophilus TaxID=1812810 RepID=UPI00083FBDD7|nr:ATP-binding protein [Rhodohalobacter halophilus]
MKFKLGSRWLENRDEVTKLLQRVLDESGSSDKYLFEVGEGITIFKEGEPLNNIYILLEGEVQLYKKKPYNDVQFPLQHLQAGSLIGIISFMTGLPSLTTAKTHEPCRFLRIPKKDVNHLIDLHPELDSYLDELIMANLLERYRQTIILQMKLDSVNSKLQNERNELKQAYKDLQNAQKALVHQEKMATLGQLVAGFAHEVNNPTAALLRSTDSLERQLVQFMDQQSEGEDSALTDTGKQFFKLGREIGFPDTKTIRERSERVKRALPVLKNSQIRIIAQMPEGYEELLQKVTDGNQEEIGYLLDQFEFGKMFQNIETAGERIAGLVKSLKSYSRSDSEERYEWIDIREGIHDTLQLTSNRIKYYDLYLDLPEVPKIRADAAGLNQVWTNIILNASDAMGKKGSLDIRCGVSDERIWVSVTDSGPGISEDYLEKIFDPKFTTKVSGAKFGLGLGLSISLDIIKQHGGEIQVVNADEGGARFTVILPVDPKLTPASR